jgi:hypothetical protein
MGDNRGESEESRDYGPIAQDRLIGRIDLRVPSIGRLIGA